jgi:hypothetical protein
MIRHLIYFLLKHLRRLGGYRGVYMITHQGQGFSLNDFYSQGHFSTRAKLKDTYADIYHGLIEQAKLVPMEEFSLLVFYNSAHDPDNIVGMSKVFCDVLTGGGGRKKEKKYPVYIPDDGKKNLKFVGICPDISLAKNTFQFMLIHHS